jgi:hypothetical protein
MKGVGENDNIHNFGYCGGRIGYYYDRNRPDCGSERGCDIRRSDHLHYPDLGNRQRHQKSKKEGPLTAASSFYIYERGFYNVGNAENRGTKIR